MASRRSSNSLVSTGKRPQKTTGWDGLKPGSAWAVGRFSWVMVSPTRGVADLLDGGVEVADLAGAEALDGGHGGAVDADVVDVVGAAGLHHADAVALLQGAVDDAHDTDDAEVLVVLGVDQHRLEGRIGVAAGGRGEAGDDGLQHVWDADAGLGGDFHRLGGVDADHVLDLGTDAIGFGGGQVDLVEDRHDLVVGIDGLVDVGQRLRLHALGGVDDQQAALDGAHGAADLIAEIDVARRVDQVEDVGLAVARGVFDAHGVGLDGDAALALDVHRVEELLLHVAFGDGAGELDQPVGQGGFPVVDMGDDGEIADVREVGHARDMRRKRGGGQWSAEGAGPRDEAPGSRIWGRVPVAWR